MPDHASLTAKIEKETLAAPTSTAQSTAVTTSTSPTTTQHSTAPTTAIHKTTPTSQHNDTCAPPTITDIQESASRASRASNNKSSVEIPTHSSFNPDNMTDADREAAATLISLSESDHNPNSSFNSSRSSSFADPRPAHQSYGASVPDAGYSSSLFSGVIASTASHDFIARTLSRNVASFATSRNSASFATATSRNVASSNPMYSTDTMYTTTPMYTTNPTSIAPRKRSRDIDDDTYNEYASHPAPHSSSPPAPKRRSVSPTKKPATQAAPVSPLPHEHIDAHQAFAIGAEYVFQYIQERGYFALGEDLRAKIAGEMQGATADSNGSALAEHGTHGVVDGGEKHANSARGFWDVV